MRRGVLWVAALAAALGCTSKHEPREELSPSGRDGSVTHDAESGDGTGRGADEGEAIGPLHEAGTSEDGAVRDGAPADARAGRRCPKDMVDIVGRFCIDRYEDILVDDTTGQPLSPHYPPEPGLALRMFEKWKTERFNVGPPAAQALDLPRLSEFEQKAEFQPRAVSRRGVLPQGYTSGKMANAACARAGKRLCTLQEWRYACRGQKGTKYPYGDEYTQGLCNVYRAQHPAALLHNNPSTGHSDPRLGLVRGADGPLLRPTGTTPKCLSRWGRDAVYDMVGNVDEWIDDPGGTFVGGFFSRSTREGCDSIITVHPYEYWDYSLGVRCCRSID